MNEGQIKPKKSFLRRFWFMGAICLLLIVMTVFIIGKIHDRQLTEEQRNQSIDEAIVKEADEKKNKEQNERPESIWPNASAKYITAVPVDLTQIESISKYRSCAGHDRSGYNFDQVLETDRSMKHYFFPTQEFLDTTDKIKIFAPFDGTVLFFVRNSYKFPGRIDGSIVLSTPIDKNVAFQFGHVNFAQDYQVGDKIEADQFIGYAATYEAGDFDLDLTGWKKNDGIEILDSIFDHMTNSVLAEFAKYGVTPQNSKFTKEYRDSHPCSYPNTGREHQGRENDDWVKLRH